MSRPTTSAMVYAQRRRDEEKRTVDDLKSIIPEECFRPEVEGNGNFNVTTKVMKAAEYYIQASEQEMMDESSDAGAKGKGKGKAKKGDEEGLPLRGVPASRQDRNPSEERRHNDMIQGQAATTALPSPFVSVLPEIQQLRQGARRLVAVAEMKADAVGSGGMSEALRESMEKGSDLLIDLIKVIEQEGWSEEMKGKWERERREWVGKVRLD